MAELTKKDAAALRKEGVRILQALDKDQCLDLSLHLYSAHLLRRLDPAFPPRPWTQWPVGGRRTNLDSASSPPDHRAPFPDLEYCSCDDPTKDALASAVVTNTIHNDLHDRGVTLTSAMTRAAGVVAYELNTAFERAVARRLHCQGHQMVIDPAPVLPAQSLAQVFITLNSLLDQITGNTSLPQPKRPKLKPTADPVECTSNGWIDVVYSLVGHGDTLGRCQRLFDQPLDRLDYQMLSLGGPELLRAPDHALNRYLGRTTPRPSDEELLADQFVDLAEVPPEFRKTTRALKRAKRHLRAEVMALESIVGKHPLEVMHPDVYWDAMNQRALDPLPVVQDGQVVALQDSLVVETEQEVRLKKQATARAVSARRRVETLRLRRQAARALLALHM